MRQSGWGYAERGSTPRVYRGQPAAAMQGCGAEAARSDLEKNQKLRPLGVVIKRVTSGRRPGPSTDRPGPGESVTCSGLGFLPLVTGIGRTERSNGGDSLALGKHRGKSADSSRGSPFRNADEHLTLLKCPSPRAVRFHPPLPNLQHHYDQGLSPPVPPALDVRGPFSSILVDLEGGRGRHVPSSHWEPQSAQRDRHPASSSPSTPLRPTSQSAASDCEELKGSSI